MAFNATTTVAGSGQVASLLATYFEKVMLETFDLNLVYHKQGMQHTMPKGRGKTVRFNGFKRLAGKVGALSEAVVPDAIVLSTRYVEATVKQFGGYVIISDLLDFTAALDVHAGAVERISVDEAEAIDTFVRNKCLSDSDAEYPGSGTMSTWWNAKNGGFSCSYFSAGLDDDATFALAQSRFSTIGAAITDGYGMTLKKILRGVTFLRKMNVPTFEDKKYHLIMHPTVELDLIINDPDYRAWNQYTQPEKIENASVGSKIAGVGFYTSQNCYTFSAIAGSTTIPTAYFSTLLGKDALIVSKIDGEFKSYVTTMQPDKADPLGQYYTVGAKGYVAAVAQNLSAALNLVTFSNL